MSFQFSADFRSRLLALPERLRRAGQGDGSGSGRRRGGRLEFREHRAYAPGDDPRDLDWNLFMRLDQLVAKEYGRDEVPEVLVLLDRSGSMGGVGKDRCVREVAAGLSYLGLLVNAPVVVALAGEGGPVFVGRYQSHRRLDQVLAMIEALHAPQGPTHLKACAHLPPVSGRGRMAFLLSDFLFEPLPAATIVAVARGGGLGGLVHVIAQDERQCAPGRQMTLEDVESRARLRIQDPAGFTESYARELAAHQDAVARLAGQHGLGFAIIDDVTAFETNVANIVGRRA